MNAKMRAALWAWQDEYYREHDRDIVCAEAVNWALGYLRSEQEQFRKEVLAVREVWLLENTVEDGTDHVTPFDQFLYEEAASSDLPPRDTSRTAEAQGLFHKFDVRRTDGSSAPGEKHHGCYYFVIDVDHDVHAKAALTAYAAACESTHPELARDLREKWGAINASSIPGAALEWAKRVVEIDSIVESNGVEPFYGQGCVLAAKALLQLSTNSKEV